MTRVPAGRTFGLTGIWRSVCVFVLVLSVYCEAAAQPRRLLRLISMRPLSLRSRSGAPIPVDVTLDWAGMGLLEGRLEATFTIDRQVLGRYQSAELALTTGQQTFKMLFPAMTVPWEQQQVQAALQFRTRRGVLKLGTTPLSVPDARRRALTICISAPWETRDAWTDALAKGLRFDTLGTTKRERVTPGLSVQPVRVQPEDLPTYPLGYCSYDVVLLSGRGFGQLQNRQLKALERWVEAGGSVCVAPHGNVKHYHVDFLNALTGEDSKPFGRDVDGSVTTSGEPAAEHVSRFHCGLGRVVVLMGGPGAGVSPDSPASAPLVCFLWKMRRDAAGQVLRGGVLPDIDSEAYGAQPIQSTSELLRGLLPRTARLVPLWLIVLVLLLFVLAVGPADYVLLGLVKLRKLTWLVFPVLSIALMLFMVHLSEGYMGRTDHRTSVVFIDVGRDGRALRTNRYELIFAARSQETTTELKHAFFTPIDHRYLESASYYRYRYRQYGEIIGPPTYSGRMPTHYTAVQQIRKWTPQLNRIFSLEPLEAGPQLNWDALDASMFQSVSGRWKAMEVLTAQGAGRSSVEETPAGKGQFDGHVLFMHMAQIYRTGTHGERTRRGARFVGRAPFEQFIRDASVRKGSRGLFSILSQISPTMADNFEDLATLDPTDPGQWLVAAVFKRGDDTVICRRLYYGD